MSGITRRSFVAGSVAGGCVLAAGCSSAPLASGSDFRSLYSSADATTLARLVRAGEVKPVELLDEAIRRTEMLNPVINAVTQKHFDYAREYLNTQYSPSGPFAGVPFLLKDLGIQLAGTSTTGSSRLLQGIKAPKDSLLTKRLKDAGFVMFGKTNTPEFGMALTTESTLYGPCRNPWNLEHSTGGSSGGSAAAVAAGILPVAHATDGGGSIRVPAAACGIFGFKPTRALTPRRTGASMMSVSHVVSRTVRDSAAVLEATAGSAPGYPFVSTEPVGGYVEAIKRPPKRLKIALVLDEPALKLNVDVDAAIHRCAQALTDSGHDVDIAKPGVDFEKLNAAQTTLMLSEFSQGLIGLSKLIDRPLNTQTLERLSVEFIEQGEKISAGEYLNAWEHIQSVTASMASFFQTWDIMLSPVTVTPPPKLGVINEHDDDNYSTFVDRFRTYSAYTPLQNLTGVPAASIPVGLSSNGLPVAAMVSTSLGQDALLMSVCRQLEEALPFYSKRPPVFAT